MTEGKPDGLLAGPRGRRLLVEVAEHIVGRRPEHPTSTAWWSPVFGRPEGYDLSADSITSCLHRLQQLLGLVDLDAVAAHQDPYLFLMGLGASVDTARYWQDPDEADLVLADPRALDMLQPLAAAVLAAPASAWWRDGLDHQTQQHVTWVREARDRVASAPVLTGAAGALRTWRTEQEAQEMSARDQRPRDVHAAWSGEWWSPPAMAVIDTSPVVALPGTADVLALGLAFVEDGGDAREAVVHPVRPRPRARIYEIHDANAWRDLIEAHPRDVTWSRRHDWWRASGWTGAWALPDWDSVAREWDGVHLSAIGYLTVSGLLIPTAVPGIADDGVTPGPARTLLAGWSPGQTWWLTDVLEPAGPAEQWQAEEHDDLLRWSRT